MDSAQLEFNARLKAIEKRRTRLRAGVTYRVSRDGLIVAHPRSRLASFPIKGIVVIVAAAFLLKVGLFLSLGQDAYADKIATFAQGTSFDQMVASVMQPDAVTLWIADRAYPFIN